MKVLKRKDCVVIRGDGKFECIVCGRRWISKHISHEADCVFKNNAITGIRIDGISGGVVFHPVDDYKTWVSPASGETYCIERWPGCWVLIDENRTAIKQCKHLHTLRQWVGLNQGVL